MRSKHQPKCRPLLKQAIEIDTPDPRYWNADYDCIWILVSEQRLMLARY